MITDIRAAQALKTKVEEKILDLVNTYEVETGLKIAHIEQIKSCNTAGKQFIVGIRLEVNF